MFGKIKGRKKVIKNIIIKKDDDTAVIDFIMIHETGVYTFDYIDYQEGWIFGTEYDNNWTKTSPDAINIERFKNPTLKYKEYIKIFSIYLTSPDNIPLYSYIIFNDESKLKSISIATENIKVLNEENLIKYLSNDIKNKKATITKKSIKTLYKTISENKLIEVKA